MGLKLPAIFAQIPTYAPRFSGGARTASQTVQSVTDSVASPAKLHSSEDVRKPDAFLVGYGGIGQRVANKNAMGSK